MTRWIEPQPINTSSLDSLGLHPLVAQTLVRRGFTTPDSARAFLDPLHSPSTSASMLPGIDRAIERIQSAIRLCEPICVWGDFDVDGQTATTILVQTLQILGADVTYHIPIRIRESHGVNIENLAPIIDQGAKLILTCDTGISASDAVEYARQRGTDFVITDHHDLPDELPQAAAVVNPKLLPQGHPLAALPGAGVAYKLAEILLGNRVSETSTNSDPKIQSPEFLLDLAALGIVADLALLLGETRALAQKGLQVLRGTQRLGLKALAELAGLDLSQTTEEHIGFILGPRLNALGRLSDANPAVELLSTQNPARARLLAAQIEGLNTQRKLLTDQVYQAAEAQLRADPSLLLKPVILLTHPSWPGGVIGIVANRLVDRYHKPTILLAGTPNEIMQGSARSVEGLNITAAIASHKELLLTFGGHPMAAGLSLEPNRIDEFRKGLNQTVEKTLGETIREEPILQVDAWTELPLLTLDLANSLEQLAPFGPGNPLLVLAVRNLNLKSVTEIGKAKEHRKLLVADQERATQEVLWWNGAGEELPDNLASGGGKFDLAFSLRANTFRGERRITLEFVDFRPVEEKPVEVKPTRIEIVDGRSNPTEYDRLNILMFAEGEDKKKVRGADRYSLSPAGELAIYTTPPGPSELRLILEQVKPHKIYLFGVTSTEEKPDEFLTRLGGMAKFAVSKRDGKVSIAELAAATAQREITIRLGLEWLASGGHLLVEGEDDKLHLTSGDGVANQYLQSEFFLAIKGLLEETAAYRRHFSSARAESLFKF